MHRFLSGTILLLGTVVRALKHPASPLLALLLCSLLAPLAQAQTAYTVTDIAPLGTYTYSNGTTWNGNSPYAVNNSGQVVGTTSAPSSTNHAFLYSGGVTTDLGTPLVSSCGSGYALGYATGINDSGQIVGTSYCSDGSQSTGWLLTNGTAVAIPATPACRSNYSIPYAINASGQVTGFTCNPATGGIQAFFWDGTSANVTGLGTLSGALSIGNAINKSGQITGYSYAPGVSTAAFLYSGGVMTNLGVLATGLESYGTAINDAGQVAGWSFTSNHSSPHAMLYDGTTLNDLGTFNGGGTMANGLNNSGQIVGNYVLSAAPYNAAFLYTPGSGFVDLNTLQPSGSSLTLFTAEQISDKGYIIGTHLVTQAGNQFEYAYLLSPGNTSIGTGVVVQPGNTTATGTPVTLTFSTVTQAGLTTLTTSSSGPPLPSGFKLGQPATYYNLATTAVYSGPISICINYAGVTFNNPNRIVLWHYDTTTASWTQLQTTVNTSTTTACATTPSLSPFALLEPVYAAQVQQPINADGSSVFSASKGVVPVKFTLSVGGVATCTLPPATIAVTRISGGTASSIDESLYSMSADNGSNFRIDSANCQYVYNLASSSLGQGTYRVDILINNTSVGSGFITLR